MEGDALHVWCELELANLDTLALLSFIPHHHEGGVHVAESWAKSIESIRLTRGRLADLDAHRRIEFGCFVSFDSKLTGDVLRSADATTSTSVERKLGARMRPDEGRAESACLAKDATSAPTCVEGAEELLVSCRLFPRLGKAYRGQKECRRGKSISGAWCGGFNHTCFKLEGFVDAPRACSRLGHEEPNARVVGSEFRKGLIVTIGFFEPAVGATEITKATAREGVCWRKLNDLTKDTTRFVFFGEPQKHLTDGGANAHICRWVTT